MRVIKERLNNVILLLHYWQGRCVGRHTRAAIQPIKKKEKKESFYEF